MSVIVQLTCGEAHKNLGETIEGYLKVLTVDDLSNLFRFKATWFRSV